MKLTGQFKIDFEEWLFKKYTDKDSIRVSPAHHLIFDIRQHFYNLPFSMQYGVYIDFLESIGREVSVQLFIKVNGHQNIVDKKYVAMTLSKNNYEVLVNSHSRKEAQREIIEMEIKIYNNR